MGDTIFLSHYLNLHTPLYGGKENQIEIKEISSILNGDTANSKRLKFPNHVGTHIDFPFHFDNNGKKIQDYKPSFWIFKNIGIINDQVENIESQFNIIDKNIDFLIIKTGFGKFRNQKIYWQRQPVFPSYLASKIKIHFPKIRAIGFDMISLTSQLDKQEGKKAHIEFLVKNDIIVIEDMNLENLNSTPFELIVSPLLIEDIDGCPCTIIARL